MHLWQNNSIIKSHKNYNLNAVKANRPKGISDEDWANIVKEEKLNKQIILNLVPKVSQKKQVDKK
jgi:hypothetical protein